VDLMGYGSERSRSSFRLAEYCEYLIHVRTARESSVRRPMEGDESAEGRDGDGGERRKR
jgi:hypothetical protein